MLLTVPEPWPPGQQRCLHGQSSSSTLAGLVPGLARPRSRSALSLATRSPALREPGRNHRPRAARRAARGSAGLREPRRGGQPGWRPLRPDRGCKALPGVAGRSGAAQRGVTAAQVTISGSPSPCQGEQALNREGHRTAFAGRGQAAAARTSPEPGSSLPRRTWSP